MSQASDNLAAAVNSLAAEVPVIVAALQAGNGVPDSVLQGFADQINAAMDQVKAAVPPAPEPTP